MLHFPEITEQKLHRSALLITPGHYCQLHHVETQVTEKEYESASFPGYIHHSQLNLNVRSSYNIWKQYTKNRHLSEIQI